MLEVRLLGQFDLRQNGEPIPLPSRAAQSLLAYLILTAGTPQRRERLAGLLWPDATDADARGYLRKELWRIRKAIGSHYLLADDIAIAFNPQADYWLDAAALTETDTDEDTVTLTRALSVYQGELLPGFYDEWVVLARQRLLAAFERKMQVLLAWLMAEGRLDEVETWSERWLALGHSPEPAYRALMLAHARRGDRARMAVIYQRCVAALRDDLGVEPSEQTQQLYARLARGDSVQANGLTRTSSIHLTPVGTPDTAPPAPGAPPFKGLHYFDEADAPLFFGREELTARLVRRLHEARCLAVVGASGSGKSSLVRAGVIPALRLAAPAWRIHLFTPTRHPLEALAISLTQSAPLPLGAARLLDDLSRDARSLHRLACSTRASATRLLLVVDQFEELFTLCQSETERQAFIDNLMTAVAPQVNDRVRVLLTLRADFYAHCAQYPTLRETLATCQEYIGPMDASEMRRAIESPARQTDWAFEPGLVDLILRDVGREPGALPLLSHALLETWRRRRGRTLTLEGYAEAGTVRGAIARTAETVYNQYLAPEQQPIARRIFLRLTEPGEGQQDTRRRATLHELTPDASQVGAVQAVLHTLADARLITLEQATAEVAHEALIREWPTLRQWLDGSRADLRLERQLATAANEWAAADHDRSFLATGVRLAHFETLTEHGDIGLTAEERAYIEASVVERERRDMAERERQSELVAQRDAAEKARAEADLQRQMALAREVAANAVSNLNVDPERSILLALRAVLMSSKGGRPVLREAEEALHRAVQTSRVKLTLRGHTNSLDGVAFSPDGRRLATRSLDGTARLWDAETGHQLLTLPTRVTHAPPGAFVGTVEFSPDGKRLITASAANTATIWDTTTGAMLLTLSGHTDGVLGVAFSPDGRCVATASMDKRAKVWDAVTAQELFTLVGHTELVAYVAFSADGSRLVTASQDKTARIWDATTGRELLILRGHTNTVRNAVFSPDGKRLATVGFGDGTVKVWDTVSGQELLTLFRRSASGNSVAYNRTGTRLAMGSGDGVATIWDAMTGQLLLELHGHTSAVNQLAFSPDPEGHRLITAGDDATARVWDVSPVGGREWVTLAGHSDRVRDIAYSPNGACLATAGADKTVRLWDAASGQEVLTLVGHLGEVRAVAISPDGRRLATTSDDQTVRVWDAVTGQALLILSIESTISPSTNHSVAFSPDGGYLAAESRGTVAKIYNASTGQEELTLTGHTALLRAIVFSSDGQRIATASADGKAKIWDATTGQELLTLVGHSGPLYAVAFSPDEMRLATGSIDGTAKVWDGLTGKELFTLTGHSGIVFSVAFDTNGTRLATSSSDGTVKVWNITANGGPGEEPLTLFGHYGEIYKVVFSPDGRRLATASRDGTARVYALPLEDIVQIAKSRLTRSLTTDECQKFLHLDQCPPGP